MPKICRPAPFPINGAARLSPLYKSKRCKVLKSNKDFAPFLYAMHVVLADLCVSSQQSFRLHYSLLRPVTFISTARPS